MLCSCIEQLKQFGYKVGGFYTREIRDKRGRVGFGITSLDGSSGILADLKVTSNMPRVGRYRVHLEEFERVGVASVNQAIKDAEVIIVDEIGKMELFSPGFCRVVRLALDSSKPLIGTLGQIRHPLITEINERSDVRQMTLFKDNHNQLLQEIIGWVKEKFVEEGRSNNK